jgi:putative ABC transport system permease protein
MFRNYLKFAFRNLLRNKFFSIINIFGLTIGISSCIMIFLFVFDELQYGQDHEKKENIYRILRGRNDWSVITPMKLMPVLRENVPAIESAVQIKKRNCVVTFENDFYNESEVLYADSNFLEFFDCDLLIGDRKTALERPDAIILTQEMVRKYFGDQDPIGKIMKIDNIAPVVVSGVIKESPKFKPFSLDFLVNVEVLKYNNSGAFTNWDNNSFQSYVQINSNANPDMIAESIPAFVAKARGWDEIGYARYKLQPYTKIHLYSKGLGYENFIRGDASVVYSFLGVAILVLVLACFNYTNLSTAQAAKRAKEIGIRKTIGATRLQLILQFLIEVFILTIISVVISLIFVEILLPGFNHLIGKSLSLYALDPFAIIISVLFFVCLVSLMAGFYPAFILSSYQPVKVLKGSGPSGPESMKKGGFAIRFRQVMIVFQLASSVALIIIAVLIKSQIEFAANKNLGMQPDQLVVLNNVRASGMKQRYENLKADLGQYPEIRNLSGAFNVPGEDINNWCTLRLRSEDNDNNIGCGYIFIDEEYFDVIGAKILKGRAFLSNSEYEDANSCIINETTARMLNIYDDPVGQQVFGFFDDTVRTVVGMVNDIHFKSLHESVPPVIYRSGDGFPSYFYRLVLKIESKNVSKTIEMIEDAWIQHVPEWPIQLRFISEEFENMYSSEKKVSIQMTIFTLLAIFISLLGLFGLIAFVAVSRRKEISIRKTLGASLTNIVLSLGKEFIMLTFIANLVAWPIIYFVSLRWLQNFTDSVAINYLWYPISGLIVLSIVMLIVSYHSFQTAKQNPIIALKYE